MYKVMEDLQDIPNLSNDLIYAENGMRDAWNKEVEQKGYEKGIEKRVTFDETDKPIFKILDYSKNEPTRNINHTHNIHLEQINDRRQTFWENRTFEVSGELNLYNVKIKNKDIETLNGTWEANAFHIIKEKWALIAAKRRNNLKRNTRENNYVFIYYLPLDLLVGAKRGTWGYDNYPYIIGWCKYLWNHEPPSKLYEDLIGESELTISSGLSSISDSCGRSNASSTSSLSSSDSFRSESFSWGGKQRKTKRKQTKKRRKTKKKYPHRKWYK
jgi:hypothetical protein